MKEMKDNEEDYSYSDDYEDDDFELGSSDESISDERISANETYQDRIQNRDIRETCIQTVNIQPLHSKRTGTATINMSSKIIQCYEVESDLELTTLLEEVKQKRYMKKSLSIEPDAIDDIAYRNFMKQKPAMLEQLLLEEQFAMTRKITKELDVSFGCTQNDQNDMNSLLSHTTLTFVSCFYQPSIILSMHSIDDNLKPSGQDLIHIKTAICFWLAVSPHKPLKVALSQGVVNKDCICIMQNLAVICGTKEGCIQLWDIREPLTSQCKTNQLLKNTSDYFLENSDTALVALERVSNTDIASLDDKGTLELWSLKDTNKSLDLVRFKVIKNISSLIEGVIDLDDNYCPINYIKSTPSGDDLLCPLNDGRVALLPLTDVIVPTETPMIYLPNCHLEKDGNYRGMYESTVDEIVFSPFDEDIFFLLWSNGSIGLFHRKDSVAALYLNSWNYIPGIMSLSSSSLSSNNIEESIDTAISIQWSQMNPCSFYVLTKHGYYLTFNLLKSQLPVKVQKLNFKGSIKMMTKDSNNIVMMTLIPSYTKNVLPTVVIKHRNGQQCFSIKQFEANAMKECHVDNELKMLRNLFYNKKKID